MRSRKASALLTCILLGLVVAASAQEKKYVIIDQDAAGPAGTGQQSILVLLQAPQVEVLGITIVTGDAWRDEEIAHTLRMLELVGRSDVPVVPGAVSPIIRTKQWTSNWELLYGKVAYKGAWENGGHEVSAIPPIPEGTPKTKAADEDAAHFLVRMVKAHPHQVTIYAGGPLTNLAQAIGICPEFAELTKGLIAMGASLNPRTDDPEFATNPRREFNFWFDPEAAHVVLNAHWPAIIVTTVDVSIQTSFTEAMFKEISEARTPVAQYLARFARDGRGYMWDELTAAAWLEPSLITKERQVYMDVSLDKGASYGEVLIWSENLKPGLNLQLVHAQVEVDMKKFSEFFVKLMTGPTPGAKNPLMLKDFPLSRGAGLR